MSNKITITLPDSSKIEAEQGTSVFDIAGLIGKKLQASALAAIVDGKAVDLSYQLDRDSNVRIITFADDEGRTIFWHSAAHLMAQAVKRLYPTALFAIGPAIENGFYYDIDINTPFTPEDLVSIEEEMTKITDEKIDIIRETLGKDKALAFFGRSGENYKVEMISEMTDDTVSIYHQGEFSDLCRGPHVRNTSVIKAFKLLAIAGAYWRGDEKNKMLQRIYGVAFPSADMLKKHLDMLEEAKKRDHRKLGKELDIFSFSHDVGAGLPLWHPNGAVLRFVIDKFETSEHLKRGYKLYTTPHIARSNLYETSGHLGFYSGNMYAPIQIDGQDYYLKPMNCPSQIQIFNSSMKSYRDLPVKAFEMGTVYRYERSGVLHGLTRVRGFTQDDAHIFCREDQIEDEIVKVLDFTIEILHVFGFKEKNVYLSTRPEKSVGSERNWEISTEALRAALNKNRIDYKIDPGEGVFYGPKIDIKIKDAIGREWQCSTIQVDFNLPERFDMHYIGSDGQKHRPIMIHRALLGSLERFIGILIEHYGGKFPVWLAPVQLMILSISDEQAAYVEKLRERMLAEELRPEIDTRSESIGYKIRDAISQKVPFICVAGQKEIEEGTLSVRRRGENKSVSMTVDDFVVMIKEEIKNKYY
ncbi:MAG: threonine--tRNA ligase [Spirochaetia bacterium]|jgi:threonyl-tRNA synthetase|nr:threonine--tRNA ligase [Spirochaetia bacterium]